MQLSNIYLSFSLVYNIAKSAELSGHAKICRTGYRISSASLCVLRLGEGEEDGNPHGGSVNLLRVYNRGIYIHQFDNFFPSPTTLYW